MSKTIAVNDKNFETEVVNSKIPVLVDFWAEWCGPCRAIAIYIEEIADEFEGKLKVVKLNVDENPNTPSDLGIRSIPTLMIYKDGVVVQTLLGSRPKGTITGMIDRVIKPNENE